MLDDIQREMYQLVGLTYRSNSENNALTLNPIDIIKGNIIAANTDGTLEELISPYTVDELTEALKKTGKDYVLGSQKITIDQEENMKTSNILTGTVESMSHNDAVDYDIVFKNPADPRKVDFNCQCKKLYKVRQTRSIFSPFLLEQYDSDAFYTHYTCPHVVAFAKTVEKKTDSNLFGIKTPRYMKPYVLSYIEAVKAEPRMPEYMLDHAFFHSSLLDDAIGQINGLRKEDGLDKLDITGQMDAARYFIDQHKENDGKKLDKVIKLVSY